MDREQLLSGYLFFTGKGGVGKTSLSCATGLSLAESGKRVLIVSTGPASNLDEVLRTRGEMPEAVTQLLPRLRDPAFTRVIVVTLAEATPVHEAERLQRDLARAGIKPFAWVIEQSLLGSGTRDPLPSLRGDYEFSFIRRVADELAPRCALVPRLAVAPVGVDGLQQLAS